jgi:hypothetical protein
MELQLPQLSQTSAQQLMGLQTANPQLSKAFLETGSSWFAILKIDNLAIWTDDPLRHRTPVAVFIGRRYCHVAFGSIVHAFPANAVAHFMTQIP